MKLVTSELEEFGRVSYTGRQAYGGQEAIKASRLYVDNKALLQTSNVDSDKRRNNGRREATREYAGEKKPWHWLEMADKIWQGWLMERNSGDERRW